MLLYAAGTERVDMCLAFSWSYYDCPQFNSIIPVHLVFFRVLLFVGYVSIFAVCIMYVFLLFCWGGVGSFEGPRPVLAACHCLWQIKFILLTSS